MSSKAKPDSSQNDNKKDSANYLKCKEKPEFIKKLTKVLILVASIYLFSRLFVSLYHLALGYKTNQLSGTITKELCDKSCYLFVDEIKIETGPRTFLPHYNWQYEETFEKRGQVFFAGTDIFDNKTVGSKLWFFARKLDENSYTIYGSPFFFAYVSDKP